MNDQSLKRRPLRYAWSHQAKTHRAVMRAANGILKQIPDGPKYQVGMLLRRSSLPYNLAGGLNVVQIGAPFDTLAAGRSRGAYLGLAAGSGGNLLIVEPLAKSVSAFEKFADKHLKCGVTVVNNAVWSEPGEVELFVDDSHPATNFSDKTGVEYDDERLSEYRKVTVPSKTLDSIVEDAGFPQPDLVSITTNWAEQEILKGMTKMLAAGVRFVSLALGEDREDYRDLMDTLGYEALGFEDRGVTYRLRS